MKLREFRNSDNDFDTNNQQMNYKECIQSINREIKRKLNPPHSSQTIGANIIKTIPEVTRYATARVTDAKSALEIVFNSTIENEIIKMTNIKREKVYKKQWENIGSKTFQAYTVLLLLAGVYKSYGE
ncbi:hypothetical protein TNCT_699641 [Trichonephila clavata]|uniref:Uncharacterized protein n=1 Tax=Trichonephila clavata TaxID=2740835 RepID=A0A8X6H5F9_TRICU|nr:hypothetical protein TNCT_699641 [Trichonephila clavata]